MTDQTQFHAGLARRRQVLGDEYVDNAVQRTDPFNASFQALITENIWGDVWGRPGVSLSQRSLMTLAFLIALNRPHELRLHLKAARRNGCTMEEIRELVVQASAYCGAPAAVDAMRQVNEVLADDIRAMRDGD